MKKPIVYGLLPLGMVCFVALADYAVRGPKAKRHLAGLVDELRAIPDVKDASVTGSFSGYKTLHASAVRSLAWIIHEFAGEKRKGALKD